MPCIWLFLLLSYSFGAFAWGERGHDSVTRVAVQHLREMTDDNPAIMRPFLMKDHMLAHISNVPDIVWRADYQSEEVRMTNGPTHFISLEKVLSHSENDADLPVGFDSYRTLCKAKGLSTTDVGTAPWRILQFYRAMVIELTGLENKPREMQLEHINHALVLAGLMSHFVADLANPMHTTENYDGQLSKAHGLHAYFESAVLAEMPLTLNDSVLKRASKKKLWLKRHDSDERKSIRSNPQKLVWALLTDSHSKLAELLAIDEKHSILTPGNDQANAERKAPKSVVRWYKKFAEQQLAIGADVLAQLWLLAWQEAGKPDMSGYFSYYYLVQPPFITPDYTD